MSLFVANNFSPMATGLISGLHTGMSKLIYRGRTLQLAVWWLPCGQIASVLWQCLNRCRTAPRLCYLCHEMFHKTACTHDNDALCLRCDYLRWSEVRVWARIKWCGCDVIRFMVLPIVTFPAYVNLVNAIFRTTSTTRHSTVLFHKILH